MGMLTGKVALVTGAGQGVGQGHRLRPRRRGRRGRGHGPHRVEGRGHLPADREACGGRAIALACDVKSEQALATTVDEVVRRLGGIQILVNNAQEVPLGPAARRLRRAVHRGLGIRPPRDVPADEALPSAPQGRRLDREPRRARPRCAGTCRTTAVMRRSRRRSARLTRAAACEWGRRGHPDERDPAARRPRRGWPTGSHERARPRPRRSWRRSRCATRGGLRGGHRPLRRACCARRGRATCNGQCIALDGGQAHMG
jgi:meso-butanediol dehydrogenase/(S,S)-butanediol dehydrogenase/diacetyl reductase